MFESKTTYNFSLSEFILITCYSFAIGLYLFLCRITLLILRVDWVLEYHYHNYRLLLFYIITSLPFFLSSMLSVHT